MKKLIIWWLFKWGKSYKFNLKLKLTTLLLIISLCKIEASTYSQNTRITLELDNVTVEEAFNKIESLSEFKFLYNHRKVNLDRKVSINANKERISDILDAMFLGTNVYFKVRKKQIILKSGKTKIIETIEIKVQQEEIRGQVTDISGSPLPGVNIIVDGTTNGTETDFDGNFVIETNIGDVLIFSFIGMRTFSKTIEDTSDLTIIMEEDEQSLEEVIVVGYGTTVKKKLTSSVVTVSTKELNEIPATSLGNAIAGRLAGVTISQSNGKPGSTSEIVVRGATSGDFAGNNEPLYVIDNIISTKSLFDALDVSEVANVTVLKDAASAAVYGSRAANGVVVVTTHTGTKGKSVINFTSTIGTTEPTNVPPMTSAYQQAQIIEGQRDFNGVPSDDPSRFTQAEMDYLQANDWGSFLEQSEKTPILNRVAITASGGSDKITYFMSGSHIKQTGSFENLSYEKTNFRVKVAADITDDLNVSMNMSTSNDVRDEFYWRWNGDDEDFGDFYRTANRTGAWGPGIHNGEYVANFNGWNPVHLADKGAGSRLRKSRNISTIIDINYKIPFVEGLKAGLTYNRLNIRRDQTLLKKIVKDATFGVDPNNRFLLTNEIIGVRTRSDDGANSDSLEEATEEEDSYQFNARLSYENTFGNHTVNGFFNYEAFERDDRNFWARRRGLQTELVTQLFATDPAVESQFANGGGAEKGRESYIGGLGYSFKDKLFINTSFRYDGSTKFSEDERWGFFPSVSVGWILTEEGFFKDGLDFVNFFKLRASVGTTGNDNVGDSDFPYIQSYGVGGTGPVFGENESTSNRTRIGPQADIFITWEKQTSYNVGLDFILLNNRLSTSLDFFKNEKTDLYGDRQIFIPSSSGLILGNTNYGAIDVSGFEIVTSFRDQLGDNFQYEIGFNLGYAKDKYAAIDEPESRRNYELLSGNGTSRIEGLTALGIIRTEEQLANLIASGYTHNNAEPQIGQIYYKDFRGNPQVDPEGNTPDGNIDGNDIGFIGSAENAPINYGISLNLSFKRFYLQAFAQGFAGHQRYQPQNNRFQFGSIGQSSHTQWLDAWRPDNINGSLPRFGSPNGSNDSTFWLQDADFLRMKNLNIGYDVPENLVSKIGADRVNIFVNGTNLFMIYSKIDEFDPETSGRGIPVNRSYSLGLNVTF